jgi:pyrroline-5-carboxylate reductase
MKIGIIGCGNMGSSLAIGLAAGGAISPKNLLLCDHSPAKARTLAKQIGAKAVANSTDAVRASDLVILAVKPFVVEDVLAALHSSLKGKLLLSVAAGITTQFLHARTPSSCRVVVVMPNLAMRTRQGASFYFMGKRANSRDAKAIHTLLSSVGSTLRVKKESHIVRAYLTSSGIAFYYLAIEGMARAGQHYGMRRDDALALAAQACSGAGALVLATQKEPDELIAMVATKKGTTVQGLNVLTKMHVREAFMKATLASIRKAEQMARDKNKKK